MEYTATPEEQSELLGLLSREIAYLTELVFELIRCQQTARAADGGIEAVMKGPQSDDLFGLCDKLAAQVEKRDQFFTMLREKVAVATKSTPVPGVRLRQDGSKTTSPVELV